MPSVVQEAMNYAALGWRVHPLRPPGEKYKSKGAEKVSEGKPPKLNNWPQQASTDESQINDWWDSWPQANVGVVLGPSSGIIDIECDSPEAEALLQELFESHEIVTPTFKSSKGLHRLFRYTDQLPNNKAAHWSLMPKGVEKGGIDFKIGNGNLGTYSVFPPSQHNSGVSYHWLPGLSPSECELAEIPLHVIARIQTYYDEGGLTAPSGKARPREIWSEIEKGVAEGGGPLGGRNTSAAALAGKYLSEIDTSDNGEVQSALTKLLSWNTRNHPPDDEATVTATFYSVLALEDQQRAERAATNPILSAERDSDEWRAICVLSDPIEWKVFSPHWEGFVRVSNAEFMRPSLFEDRVVEQKRFSFGYGFSAEWLGSRKNKVGLRKRLTDAAETEEPDPADCEDRFHAGLIHACFANTIEEDDLSKSTGMQGRPIKRQDGNVWFKPEYILLQAGSLKEFPTRNQINRLLRECGATWETSRVNGHPVKFRVLTPEGLKSLESISLKGIGKSENS